MASTDGDGPFPKPDFAFLGWEAGDDDIWISICVNGVRFALFVSRNEGDIKSPIALSDFSKYFAFISGVGNGNDYRGRRRRGRPISPNCCDVFIPKIETLRTPGQA
jgi:hypothetical protein